MHAAFKDEEGFPELTLSDEKTRLVHLEVLDLSISFRISTQIRVYFELMHDHTDRFRYEDVFRAISSITGGLELPNMRELSFEVVGQD